MSIENSYEGVRDYFGTLVGLAIMNGLDSFHVYYMAYDALDRMVAKPVHYVRRGQVYCPVCDRRLRTGISGTRDECCPKCGQKLDWKVDQREAER